MKVLQFAFDGNPDNPFLPHNYGPDSVVYTGTHDNDTTRGWYEALPEREQRRRVELPRPFPLRGRRRRLGVDPPGVVVAGRAGHGPAAGRVEPGVGGPDEPAREPRRATGGGGSPTTCSPRPLSRGFVNSRDSRGGCQRLDRSPDA